MQLAGMVKSPFPLVDPIMIGPMIALANVYCGAMFPELYILICIMVNSYVHVVVYITSVIDSIAALVIHIAKISLTLPQRSIINCSNFPLVVF